MPHGLLQVIRMLLPAVRLMVPKWLHTQHPAIASDVMALLGLKLLQWAGRQQHPRDFSCPKPSPLKCLCPSPQPSVPYGNQLEHTQQCD